MDRDQVIVPIFIVAGFACALKFLEIFKYYSETRRAKEEALQKRRLLSPKKSKDDQARLYGLSNKIPDKKRHPKERKRKQTIPKVKLMRRNSI